LATSGRRRWISTDQILAKLAGFLSYCQIPAKLVGIRLYWLEFGLPNTVTLPDSGQCRRISTIGYSKVPKQPKSQFDLFDFKRYDLFRTRLQLRIGFVRF